MLSTQINTMAMLLSEFDFLPIYRADLAGSRTLSFDVAVPNKVHQADLLFLPHDRVRRKTFRYALTVVDVASRYKEA